MLRRRFDTAATRGYTLAVTLAPVMTLVVLFATGRRWFG
jgi:hypothetical protein